MNVLGKGTIIFEALVNKQWLSCKIENVLYVPSARRNLFAVISALNKGMIIKSYKSKCEFVKGAEVKACVWRS